MSFLLKYPRLVPTFVRFARQAEFAFQKKISFLYLPKDFFKINHALVRSFSLANERIAASSTQKNVQENLFQKSVFQVYFDIRYKGYIFREDFNNAWQSLKSSTPFTTEQTVLLIKSCGHNLPLEAPSEKLELVKNVWDSYDTLGIKKTIEHYNALLDVYTELEHKFSPEDFLSNLEQQGLVPNLETYSKLLHALGIQGKIGKSQTFLEHMKRHSMSIDDGVFNSLILGYSLQGDFISAQGILELMKEKQLPLSSESYVNLARGYAKTGDIEKVKELIDECNNTTKISTTELLELAYTFAVNKHSEHFSAILNMIPLKKNFPTVSAKIVHRLLHKNLDKEALMLFEFRDKLESISMAQEPIQMFLKHYVRFRKPSKVLNMVEIFKEKGWSSIAFAFCLKETLIWMDVPHCLKFLRTMKKRGYPVRIHYFYPILVKTHSLGNEAVLKMIQQINSFHVRFGREAVKAFGHFYDFLPGAEFDDLEKLKGAGLRKNLVAWKILDILLFRQNVDNAIKLVTTYGVANPSVILPLSMYHAFKNLEDDHEKFVYILYYLIHNIKANRILKNQEAEVQPADYEQFIIEIVKSCSEKFILGVFQEMLKMKIPLSLRAASCVSQRFPSPEVKDLMSKLTDLKLELEKSILNRLIESYDEDVPDQEFLEKENKEDWLKLDSAIKNKMSVSYVMRVFDAVVNNPALQHDEKQKSVIKKLLTFLSLKGDIADTEKIYEFGVQKNLISANDYSFCVVAYLTRGSLDSAIQRFYKGLKATKKCSGLRELIQEIKERNFILALEDLKTLISEVQGERVAVTQLLIELAGLGYIDETKTLLQTKIPFHKRLLSAANQAMFNEGNIKYFETLLKSSRNIKELNMIDLCDYLLKLYERNGNLEKLLKFYVELDRDDVKTNTRFWNLFLDVLVNWSLDIPGELDQVLQCVIEDCKKKTVLNSTGDSDEINRKNLWRKSVVLGSGNTSDYSSDKSKDIFECFCLIHTGKLDEYFEILKKKIIADGPSEAKDLFFCCKLIPHMFKDEKYLRECNYKNNFRTNRQLTPTISMLNCKINIDLPTDKNLALMCQHSDIWNKYLTLCLRLNIPRGIYLATKNLHPNELRNVRVRDCIRVIRNELCQQLLGKKITVFYLNIINDCLNQKNYKMARKYYQEAKNKQLDVESSVNEDLLKVLKASMAPKG